MTKVAVIYYSAANKVATGFTSAGNRHGGNESTLNAARHQGRRLTSVATAIAANRELAHQVAA